MSCNIEREKAKRKIIALLNKTVERGATEDEAMTAAEKATELMTFYDIESGELEFQEKNIVKVDIPYQSYARREYIQSTSMGIAKLCQTRVWRNPSQRTNTYFGFKHDVEIATAMFAYLEETMMREVSDFELSIKCAEMVEAGYNRKSIIMSFIKGFDQRMYARLNEMAKEREQRVVLATGTALVPLKHAEIDREMKAQGVKLVTGYSSNRVSAYDAYNHGKAAADSVSLSAQVNGGHAARRLA